MTTNLELGFVPSPYQTAVFNEVENGTGNIFINAVAGAGKSSTIIAIAKILHEKGISSKEILFLAFNSDIVKALDAKVDGKFTCQTINSLGHRVLMKKLGHSKLTVDMKKYDNIIRDSLVGIVEEHAMFDAVRAMNNLLSKCMAELAEPNFEEIFSVVAHYGIDFPEVIDDKELIVKTIKNAMDMGKKLAKEQGLISFDDQIWLPTLYKWNPPAYDWVLCDEAQDLSKGKLNLALSALSSQGRFIAVADRHQAIMGFAGADAKSVDNIIAKTNPVVLPLSVCYRCPKNVISLAKEIVPHIEHHDNATDGTIHDIMEEEFLKAVKPGAMVLCRKTNPLISLCIKMISRKIGAKVKGREIGTQIKKTMQEIMGRKTSNLETFSTKMDAYSARKRANIMSRPDYDTALQNFDDKIMCVQVIVDAYMPETVKQFNEEVDSLFSDENSIVTLSTVHKAKGLEAQHVYIYMPEFLPLQWKGQKQWEREQEMNLRYVALTRSMDTLTFVNVPKKG